MQIVSFVYMLSAYSFQGVALFLWRCQSRNTTPSIAAIYQYKQNSPNIINIDQ